MHKLRTKSTCLKKVDENAKSVKRNLLPKQDSILLNKHLF